MGRGSMGSVTVVVPAYNEEVSIGETVVAIKKALSKGKVDTYEILVVDDGSSDSTKQNAKKAGAKVLSHPHNLGYGKAIKSGLKLAKNDTIVITDADGTYEIERIPDLVEKF